MTLRQKAPAGNTKAARTAGMTLIELLVGMAILGVILAVASAALMSTSQVTGQQEKQIDASASARLALFRLSEIVRQAGYIYPPNISIKIDSGRTIKTGSDALALLVPAGTTYCPSPGAGAEGTYCGFVYALVPRSEFSSILTAGSATQYALAEFRSDWVTWPKSVVPATDLKSWPAATTGLVADGVDPATTNLGNALRVTELRAIYDDPLIFDNEVTKMRTNSLINGASVTVGLRQPSPRGREATAVQQIEVFSRSVPRSAPSNLH